MMRVSGQYFMLIVICKVTIYSMLSGKGRGVSVYFHKLETLFSPLLPCVRIALYILYIYAFARVSECVQIQIHTVLVCDLSPVLRGPVCI